MCPRHTACAGSGHSGTVKRYTRLFGGRAWRIYYPTGALILSTFVEEFGRIPSGVPERTGYGLGKAQRKSPNVLRAILLKASDDIVKDQQRPDLERTG